MRVFFFFLYLFYILFPYTHSDGTCTFLAGRRPIRNKTPPSAVGSGRPRCRWPRLGGGEEIKDGRQPAGHARAAIRALRSSTAAEVTLCAETTIVAFLALFSRPPPPPPPLRSSPLPAARASANRFNDSRERRARAWRRRQLSRRRSLWPRGRWSSGAVGAQTAFLPPPHPRRLYRNPEP